jgi:hypothetical protein
VLRGVVQASGTAIMLLMTTVMTLSARVPRRGHGQPVDRHLGGARGSPPSGIAVVPGWRAMFLVVR